jgi:hypothetical protein
MMPATVTCAQCGAASTTTDYCDSCGAALAPPTGGAAPAASGSGTATAPAGGSASGTCPNCGADRTPDDAFCEVCGLDFATGEMPAPPPLPPPATADPAAPAAAPSGWTAVVEADRAYFDTNQAETPGAVTFPEGVGAHEVPLMGDEVLIGRRSESKGLFPAIDLGGAVNDPAVSHRHAFLRRQSDDSWALVDESSSNGTYVNGAGDPLPHGVLTALHDGDHVHVGAFTKITFRKVADPANPPASGTA